MEKEFYGNCGFNGNDSDASGKPFPSTFNSPEDQQITSEQSTEHPEYTSANRRLENYFLHFSSKL